MGLDKKRQIELRQLLETQRQTCLQQIQETEGLAMIHGNAVTHIDDLSELGAHVDEQQKALEILRCLRRKVDGIERAIKFIDEEKYGICEECGEPIGEERLRVLPEATRCLKCQQNCEPSDSSRRGFYRRVGTGWRV